jgi:hypothetical protein
MTVNTARLQFPVYTAGSTGTLVPELHGNFASRDWDPTGRHYRLRDGALNMLNDSNYTGAAGRAKYLSYALPRDGTRVSLDAGLR